MKKLASIAVIALFILSALPARASTSTATYAVAFGRLIVNAPAQAGAVGVGGYSYTLTGGDPTTVKVQDGNGPGVAVMVCQEAGVVETATGSCQDGGFGQLPGDDTVQKFCSTTGAIDLNAKFASGTQSIAVFVYLVDVTQRGTMCPTTGSTGTITLTY
jgi:hypothetical protein